MVSKEQLLDAVTCKAGESVLVAAKVLRDTQTRHLTVLDDEQKPIGIVSTTDINNRVVASGKNPGETKVSDIMTTPIASIDIGMSDEEACNKMIEVGTYSIPVTEDRRLIGLVDFNKLIHNLKEEK